MGCAEPSRATTRPHDNSHTDEQDDVEKEEGPSLCRDPSGAIHQVRWRKENEKEKEERNSLRRKERGKGEEKEEEKEQEKEQEEEEGNG